MASRDSTETQALRAAHDRLYALVNADAPRAIIEARTLAKNCLKTRAWLELCAAVLVDAGKASCDSSALADGISMLRAILAEAPHAPVTAYNLANALDGIARLDQTARPLWYVQTAQVRAESRALLGASAALLAKGRKLSASRCLSNLAGGLDLSYRWIEAFETFTEALHIYPDNGVASGSAARLLFRVAREGPVVARRHFLSVARRYAWHAQQHADAVRRLAGPDAVASFAKLESEQGPLFRPPEGNLSPYRRFVLRERLALSTIVEGLARRRRWDDARIISLHEDVAAGPCPPPVFAMFNCLKSDYLVARELLFAGFQEVQRGESGWYADTLDYAIYGKRSSLLLLAQRAAYDLLDHVAVALNDYLKVGLEPRSVCFSKFWRQPKSAKWPEAVEKEITAGNPALVALSEIAADLDGTRLGESQSIPLLHRHRHLRHAGTHRFTVLHDIQVGEYRECAAIEHASLDDFQRTALHTLKLARASLLHFLEVVGYRESRHRAKDGLVGTLPIFSHHRIRGRQ
jgi:hypothetical protein